MSGIARAYMTEAVTVTGRGSANGFGVYQYNGTSRDTVARVRDRRGTIKADGGREIAYDRVFSVDSDIAVTIGDRVTYSGVAHEVLSIVISRDVAGEIDHKILYCGRSA